MPRANYGQDAPGVVRNLALVGAAASLLALWPLAGGPEALRAFRWPGIAWLATAGWMIAGSRVIKLRSRDSLLDQVKLQGHESVLDVGCGRGLLLIGAAKRLSSGKATGIDLWRTVDQSGNDPAITSANAQAEGVAARIQLETGDFTRMPFPDASFDAVISSWAIHNVPSKEGRAQALRECARVLKPGGRLVILDIVPAHTYAATLRAAGLADVRTGISDFAFFVPTFKVSAHQAV